MQGGRDGVGLGDCGGDDIGLGRKAEESEVK